MIESSSPRLWHLTHPESTTGHSVVPTLLGRQGVFGTDGSLQGYELLFRAAGLSGARADLWDADGQNLATEHVIAAAFHQGFDVADGRHTSVNFTGSYLVSRDSLDCDPATVIIEIVESTDAHQALLDRLRELRAQGFRIAIDDFVANDAQCALLALADFVKIDYRDLVATGESLVALARGGNRRLVAERIETREQFDETLALGFDLFQGHYFEAAIVIAVPQPA